MLKRLAKDNHTSLLRTFVNYGCIKFYNIGPGTLTSKLQSFQQVYYPQKGGPEVNVIKLFFSQRLDENKLECFATVKILFEVNLIYRGKASEEILKNTMSAPFLGLS
jgi:hypothetical protein